MLRLLPLIALAGCFLYSEEDEFPEPVCGDGLVEAGEQCDDGNTSSDDTCSASCRRADQYVVHWHTVDISGLLHSCPQGFDRADVVVTPSTGPEVVFTAACEDGAERIQMPPVFGQDAYRVSVRFARSTDGEVYGETLPTTLREVTDVTMYETSGFVHATWDLRSASGATLDCFNANILDVTINVKSDGWVAGTVTVPCSKLDALTPPIVSGTYEVEVVTLRATATIHDVHVNPRSDLTDLGAITLTMPD